MMQVTAVTPADGTSIIGMTTLSEDTNMWHMLNENIQWVPILIVALGLMTGFGIHYKDTLRDLFRRRFKPKPVVYANVTRREIEAGARFIPSDQWGVSPMKELRRYLGWPSGRQWKKTRKLYNKFFPGGPKNAARMLMEARSSGGGHA